jgi:deazaflavin-dependent oxidoreductase (nitroreductase family)
VNGIGRALWRTGNRVSVWLYRRSHGRLGAKARGGTPVLVLTVRGRRSGRLFSCPVAYFERAGGWLVVGSAAGMPQEPQWFRNLRAAPAAVVELGQERHEVAVRVLEGAEREDAFAQVIAENPGFADYERKSGRTMPVALLTPRPAPG